MESASVRPSCQWHRGLLLAAVVIVIVAGPHLARARVAPTPVTIQGKLVFKDAHVREIWTLVETGSGVSYRLPNQPLDSTRLPISPGSTVTLACTRDAGDPSRCTKVSSAEITRAAAPVSSYDVSLRLLVMVISYTANSRCGARRGADIAAVRSAYVSQLGHSNFLRNCSYGKLTYDNVTVISTPVACTINLNYCLEDDIAAAAVAAASRQYGAAFVGSYTRYSFVLPEGLVKICQWVGLAELPGSRTWYTPDSEGVFNKGTVLQESLHNVGIFHGWRYGLEYGDNSTAMGYGNSCPSAPELWRLGWASVLDQLNSANFPAKVNKTCVLPATYLGLDKNMLKLQPDWLRNYRKQERVPCAASEGRRRS